MQKVSLIITILNEEKTIDSLLDSILKQKTIPNEVIIVDGGSDDKSVEFVNNFIRSLEERRFKLSIKLFLKKGNRSVGRNFAIEKAKYAWIAVTDAGCTLDSKWLQELLRMQKQLNTEVVAGYYSAKPRTAFQEAVVPYVLVMPDRVDEKNFLPATRSVLFSKNIWQKVGGFNEKLSDNEDYDFARKLKNSVINIGFSKKAVVIWEPCSSLKSFYKMIFRFARGDVSAGILRPKVVLVFLRYLVGTSVFIWGIIERINTGKIWILFGVIPSFLMIYLLWSIYKNYHYTPRGWYLLPLLQITSDIAVMFGSFSGFIMINKLPRT